MGYRVITAPDVISSTSWSVTVPGNQFWNPLSVVETIVTSAVAGTRQTLLQATNGTNVLWEVAFNVIKSTTLTSSYVADLLPQPAPAAALGAAFSLPAFGLAPGYVLSASILFPDVADTLALVAIWVDDLSLGSQTDTSTGSSLGGGGGPPGGGGPLPPVGPQGPPGTNIPGVNDLAPALILPSP